MFSMDSLNLNGIEDKLEKFNRELDDVQVHVHRYLDAKEDAVIRDYILVDQKANGASDELLEQLLHERMTADGEVDYERWVGLTSLTDLHTSFTSLRGRLHEISDSDPERAQRVDYFIYASLRRITRLSSIFHNEADDNNPFD